MIQSRRPLRSQRPTVLLVLVLASAFLAFAPSRGAFSERAAPVEAALRGSHAVARAIKADLLGTLDPRSTFDALWAVDAAPPGFDERWAVDDTASPGNAPAADEAPVTFAYAEIADDLIAPFEAIFANPDAVGVILRGDTGGRLANDPLGLAATSDSELKCLADAIYFEARGESRLGQIAVAQVVVNRLRSRAYPDTICGVVYQDQDARHRCQFSFACDGISDRIADRASWRRAMALARDILSDGDRLFLAEVGNSTNYHATYVSPQWAGDMKKMDTIGRHVFYEPQRRRSSG